MNKIKIYTLSSLSNPNIIRYVGKTSQTLYKRLSGHKSLAKMNKNRKYYNNSTSNWINSLLEDNDTVIIQEIDLVSSNNWEFWEKYWILQLKQWGFTLTNLTDGGVGNQNQYFSKDTREAISKALIGRSRPKEVKDKIAKKHLGKVLSEEHKQNVRKSIIKLQGRPIKQYSLEGEYIKEWSCVAEAARFYNVDKSSVMRCCQGVFKKSAGFVWKYKE